MASYDRQEAIDLIVKGLGRFRQENEIVKDVCQRYGLSWYRAAEMVTQVKQAHGGQVERRKSRFVRFLSMFSIIAGINLVAVIAYETLQGLVISLEHIPYVGNLAVFAVGAALTAGGFVGMLKKNPPE